MAVNEPQKKHSFLHSVKLVAWSFIGIRSDKGYRDDLARVNPLHVVVVGIVGALLLVVVLVGLAKWVVGS
ncbi:MAG: DUF2970 domain-containing protein [Rhodoferax sp.]|nr:DUF2970 domain-containing protein [Rhodoferax sp.]